MHRHTIAVFAIKIREEGGTTRQGKEKGYVLIGGETLCTLGEGKYRFNWGS